MRTHSTFASSSILLAVLLCAACGDDDGPSWRLVHQEQPGALLSIWGTSASDVWVVGGDARDGSGPMVLHYDGAGWQRMPTGQTQGDLWWVFGFAGGPVYMGGAGGVILRYENDTFTPMATPGTETIFGIWGATPEDMWAVGGNSNGTGGVAWRLSGDTWQVEPSLPATVPQQGAIWKVFGRSANDVWLVGSNAISLHWDGNELSEASTGVASSLFTVHSTANRFAAVGGLASGIVVENDGTGWVDATPDPLPLGLSGVCLGEGDSGYAVGQFGTVLVRDGNGWREQVLGFYLEQNLHAVWIDPEGGAWAVGGQTAAFPLTDGVLVYSGDDVPEGAIE